MSPEAGLVERLERHGQGHLLRWWDELDDALVKACESGNETAFAGALAALTDEVRSAGQALADDNFAPSDLVVPFADGTLEETRALLAQVLA